MGTNQTKTRVKGRGNWLPRKGDLIVLTVNRRLQVGILWGLGGEKRKTIQYFRPPAWKRLERALENNKTPMYPSYFYIKKEGIYSTLHENWARRMRKYSPDFLRSRRKQQYKEIQSLVKNKEFIFK